MIGDIFRQVMYMSLTASYIIVLVIAARFFLKKVPKIYSYVLWSVVLFRLLCPFTLESVISVIPQAGIFTENQINGSGDLYADNPLYITEQDIESRDINNQYSHPLNYMIQETDVNIDSNYDNNDFTATVNSGIETAQLMETPRENQPADSDAASVHSIPVILWAVGIAVLISYSLITIVRLKHKLIGAVKIERSAFTPADCELYGSKYKNNIYLSDHIRPPFVIGIIRPKIYLPFGLQENEQKYIILHEQTHIKRLDHIIKFLAFLALSIHWFNPFAWAAFILSSQDMEMSCDESVMRKVDVDVRREYSASLLNLTAGRRIIAGIPLAFGEGNTKARIKNIMNYKKPVVLITIAGAVLCLLLIISMFFNPVKNEAEFTEGIYTVNSLYNPPQFSFFMTKDITPVYYISSEHALFEKDKSDGGFSYLGELTENKLSKKEYDEIFTAEWNRLKGIYQDELFSEQEEIMNKTAYKNIAKTYKLEINEKEYNTGYMLLQLKNNELVLVRMYRGSDNELWIRFAFCLEENKDAEYRYDYFENALISRLGKESKVKIIADYSIRHDYYIAGFMSGSSDEFSDMGVCIFQNRDGGYELIDLILNENAAITGKAIAVFRVAAPYSDLYSYDVVLSNNQKLMSIHREYEGNGEIKNSYDNPQKFLGFTVFPCGRGEKKAADFTFYDEYSNRITGPEYVEPEFSSEQLAAFCENRIQYLSDTDVGNLAEALLAPDYLTLDSIQTMAGRPNKLIISYISDKTEEEITSTDAVAWLEEAAYLNSVMLKSSIEDLGEVHIKIKFKSTQGAYNWVYSYSDLSYFAEEGQDNMYSWSEEIKKLEGLQEKIKKSVDDIIIYGAGYDGTEEVLRRMGSYTIEDLKQAASYLSVDFNRDIGGICLLDSIEDKGIWIYGYTDEHFYGRGICIRIKEDGREKVILWDCDWIRSPRTNPPVIGYADYDSDGNMELAISFEDATGTGMSIWKLCMVEFIGEGKITVYEFDSEDYLDQIGNRMSSEVHNETKEVTIYDNDEAVYTYDLNWTEYEDKAIGASVRSHISYEFNGEDILLSALPETLYDGIPGGYCEADIVMKYQVNYDSSGNFTLGALSIY